MPMIGKVLVKIKSGYVAPLNPRGGAVKEHLNNLYFQTDNTLKVKNGNNGSSGRRASMGSMKPSECLATVRSIDAHAYP